MVLTILSIRFLVSKFRKKTSGDSPEIMKNPTPEIYPVIPSHSLRGYRAIPLVFFACVCVSLILGASYLGMKRAELDNAVQSTPSLSNFSPTLSFANSSEKSELYDNFVPFLISKKDKGAIAPEEPYMDNWEGLEAYFNDKRELFLHWSTTSNYPTDYFEIEKGRSLGTYTVFGTIESIRNPGMLRLFSFVDTTIQKGSTFYRIKKIKPNGDSTFSKVLQVHIP